MGIKFGVVPVIASSKGHLDLKHQPKECVITKPVASQKREVTDFELILQDKMKVKK